MAELFADEDLDLLERHTAGQELDGIDLWRLHRLGLTTWHDGRPTRTGLQAINRRRLAGTVIHIEPATDRRIYKADGTAIR